MNDCEAKVRTLEAKVRTLELTIEQLEETVTRQQAVINRLDREKQSLKAERDECKRESDAVTRTYKGFMAGGLEQFVSQMKEVMQERDEERARHNFWAYSYGDIVQQHIPKRELLERAGYDEETGTYKYPIIGISVTAFTAPSGQTKVLYGQTLYHTNDPAAVNTALWRAMLGVAPIPEPGLVKTPPDLAFLDSEEFAGDLARMFRKLLLAYGDRALYNKTRAEFWDSKVIPYLQTKYTTSAAPKTQGQHQSDFQKYVDRVLEAHFKRIEAYEKSDLAEGEGLIALPMPQILQE